MKCPVDGETLQMSERQGVEVDYCPSCRGVWLDRGELDKIIERADNQDRPRGDRDREDRPREDRSDYRDERRPPQKKKRSFLGEMFEFGD